MKFSEWLDDYGIDENEDNIFGNIDIEYYTDLDEKVDALLEAYENGKELDDLLEKLQKTPNPKAGKVTVKTIRVAGKKKKVKIKEPKFTYASDKPGMKAVRVGGKWKEVKMTAEEKKKREKGAKKALLRRK